MSSAASSSYEFGAYRLDVAQRVFTRDGHNVPLAPKTFELLLLLAQRPGRAFSKHELMTSLWPDTFVEEANLSFQISVLRKALGADAGLIETVPKHGYRFAVDVKAVSSVDRMLATPSVPSSSVPSPTVQRRANRGKLIAAIVAALAVIAIWYFAHSRTSPSDANAAAVLPPLPLTAFPGFETGPSLSPDGSQVAFSWNGPAEDNRDIYVKLVGSGEPFRLTTNPAPDHSAAWSPDGRLIAFQRATAAGSADIFTIPALGGAERKIATISLRRGPLPGGGGRTGNLSWTPDGKWIAFGGAPSQTESGGIWLSAVDHQETRRLTETGGTSFGDWEPTFSRDGRYLAFVRESTLAAHGIYVLPMSSTLTPAGSTVRITPETATISGLAWTPDDSALVFSLGPHNSILRRLYRVAAPPTTAKQQDEPELLSFGDQGTGVSISRGGRLVYATQFRDSNIWKVALTGLDETNPTLVASSTFDELTPDYSPDSKRLAFTSTRSGAEEIWISNPDGSSAVQLTTMGGPLCANPRWSPNGQTILFTSRREGSSDLYLIRPDTGELRRITDDPAEEGEPRWSRDGLTIYFGSTRTGRLEVWKMPAEGGHAVQVTRHGGTTATESPDSRFLYYAKASNISTSIWRVPVDGGEETLVVPGLSHSLNFVVATRGLYMLAAGFGRTSIDFFEYETGKRTTLLTIGKPAWVGTALSPDQQSMLYTTVDSAGSNLMVVERFR